MALVEIQDHNRNPNHNLNPNNQLSHLKMENSWDLSSTLRRKKTMNLIPNKTLKLNLFILL